MKASKEQLYKDVEYLTSITPPRNYQQLPSLETAASYICKAFDKAGAPVSRQSWTTAGNEYHNIITSYQINKQTRLVVGAHYDVCGAQPGADDNASAVAGLLELVRMLYKEKPALDYGIEFVAYSLEEPPFFASEQMGSYVHAKNLHATKAAIIGMISLEMIGYFSDAPGSQSFPSPELKKLYPNTGNFIIVVGVEEYAAFNQQIHRLMSAGSDIDVQIINLPSTNGLAGLSDQRSYWPFGYPALMINDTSFLRNPNYHLNTDTIETLDFAKMTAVVNSTYRAITGF